MTISVSVIVAIVMSFLVWVFLSLMAMFLWFGNDNAIIYGPLVAALVLILFWCWWFEMIVFVASYEILEAMG